jgi:hypothetical protein
MRRRYYIAAILIAVGLGVFVCWLGNSPRTGSKPEFLDRTPVSIDISVIGQSLTTLTNAAGIASVVEMLRSGRGVALHECKNRGTMVLRFADGQTLRIGFHPGHHFLRYEFAAPGGFFSVSRSRFFGALKAAGVDVREIPRG